jgi:hypothetical protein
MINTECPYTRARALALDAAVSTLELPGLYMLQGLLVLVDGTRLVSTLQNTLQLLTPAGWLFSIAGNKDEDKGFEDGKGANARFKNPTSMIVDAAGHIVVTDSGNHALHRVSKAGEVSTLAGNGEPGFADWQGYAARIYCPQGVALVVNDEIVVSLLGTTRSGSSRPAAPCVRSPANGRRALQTGRAPLRASTNQWA